MKRLNGGTSRCDFAYLSLIGRPTEAERWNEPLRFGVFISDWPPDRPKQALAAEQREIAAQREALAAQVGSGPFLFPPPLRTNRTRRVLHPVLIGHAVSLGPASVPARPCSGPPWR